MSPAKARATRSRCWKALIPFALLFPFGSASSCSCSSTSLFESESSSSPVARTLDVRVGSEADTTFCCLEGPAEAAALLLPSVMTLVMEISTAASSFAFSFSSSRFCFRLRSLFLDFSAEALFLPTATSCFFCTGRSASSARVSQGLDSSAGGRVLGFCDRGDVTRADVGEVGCDGPRKSVDFRVTLDVSEASEPVGRRESTYASPSQRI